jgi:hypothetical protein
MDAFCQARTPSRLERRSCNGWRASRRRCAQVLGAPARKRPRIGPSFRFRASCARWRGATNRARNIFGPTPSSRATP